MSKLWQHGTYGYLIIKIKIILEAIAVCGRNGDFSSFAMPPQNQEHPWQLGTLSEKQGGILRSSSSFGAGAQCSNARRFAGGAGACWAGLAAVGANKGGQQRGAPLPLGAEGLSKRRPYQCLTAGPSRVADGGQEPPN